MLFKKPILILLGCISVTMLSACVASLADAPTLTAAGDLSTTDGVWSGEIPRTVEGLVIHYPGDWTVETYEQAEREYFLLDIFPPKNTPPISLKVSHHDYDESSTTYPPDELTLNVLTLAENEVFLQDDGVIDEPTAFIFQGFPASMVGLQFMDATSRSEFYIRSTTVMLAGHIYNFAALGMVVSDKSAVVTREMVIQLHDLLLRNVTLQQP